MTFNTLFDLRLFFVLSHIVLFFPLFNKQIDLFTGLLLRMGQKLTVLKIIIILITTEAYTFFILSYRVLFYDRKDIKARA